MNEAQIQRIQEIEDATGIMVIDTSALRTPAQEHVESAENFLQSIKDRPLRPEEVLGRTAAFFTDAK